MKRSVAAVLLAVATLAAGGGDYESGRAAYERGNYAEALAQWLPLAERGHAEAQYGVGRLYYYGRGVDQDFAEAARWYLAAAEQGHARSQTNLGILFEEGRGVPADAERAAEWYAKAAAQGRAVARNHLARMYEEGRGVPRDERRAAELYEAAAREGHAEAQFRLARMYEEGRGVAPDPEIARKWDRRAARNGYIAAQAGTGTAGEPVASRNEDVDEAFVSVVEDAAAAPEVATAGSATAAPGAENVHEPAGATGLEPGIEAYERGDFAAAARAWRPAADSGDAEAQFRLGTLYRLGQGVTEDPFAAAEWYQRAAAQGHGMAMYMVGYLHYRGRIDGRDPDLVQAYVWFARAAKAGVGDAEDWLGRVAVRMTPAKRSEAERLVAEGDH